MTKKWYIILIGVYVIYAYLVSNYLLSLEPGYVPPVYQGGPADPKTFMSEEHIFRAFAFELTSYFLFLLKTPLDLLLLVLLMKVSVKFREIAERYFKHSFFQVAGYYLIFSLLIKVLMFPFWYFIFDLYRKMGISNQTVWEGLQGLVIPYLLQYVGSVVVMWAFYQFIEKRPKGMKVWVKVIACCIPFMVILSFVKPNYIDPLLEKNWPLQQEPLRSKIVLLLEKAGIPHADIMETHLPNTTNLMNTFMNGVGNKIRIVIEDTVLERMDDREILFVVAHEMGHYVKGHVYQSIAIYFFVSIYIFFGGFYLFHFLVSKLGPFFQIKGHKDIASIPIFLLCFSLISVPIAPLFNIHSRYMERQADEYALELTGDREAGIRAFQKFSYYNLDLGNDPDFFQFFLGTHPRLMERIDHFYHYEKK